MLDRQPRHRTSDTTFPVAYRNDKYLCNGTHEVQAGDVTLPDDMFGGGSVRSMDDIVVKAFRERSARGEIFNNPMTSWVGDYTGTLTGTWTITRIGSCTGTTMKSHSGNSLRNLLTTDWLEPTSDFWDAQMEAARIAAGTQAWANVVQPDVLGGETGRDWRKSWELIRHPLLGFHQFLDKVMRKPGWKRSGLALGEYIAGDWLKYRYGAVPLFNDLVGAFEASFKPVFTDRFTARGSASVPNLDLDDVTAVVEPGGYYSGTISRELHRQGWVRAGVLYQHELTWSDQFGLSMHNVLPTLWEWIPYSFVVDWFVNVGDFVRAVTPKARVKILSSWVVTNVETQRTIVLATTGAGNIGSYNYSGGPGCILTKEGRWRRRLPSAPRGVVPKIFDLDMSKDKNWFHIADGFALAGQKLVQKFSGRTLPAWNPWKTRGSSRGWRGGTL